MKVREIIKRLESEGWRLDRVRGGHRQFKHPTNPNVVTIPGKDSDTLPVGTLHNTLRLSGLKEQQ